MTGEAGRRLNRRNEARRRLAELMQHPGQLNVIHYSCESFDLTGGTSPRITSIAVQNMASGQSHSFSIHHASEEHDIGLRGIEEKYNVYEREMLDKFY